MKPWEEIIKDRLKEREIPLSDENFVEFRAKLDGKMSAPAEKPVSFVWVAAAVAACLSAIVILLHPDNPKVDDQIAMPPSTPVVIVPDSTTVSEPEQSVPLIAKAVSPAVVRQAYVEPQEQSVDVGPGADETISEDAKDTSPMVAPTEPPVAGNPPFIPTSTPSGTAKMRVGAAAGIIAGSGLLAAIATPFVGGINTNGDVFTPVDGIMTVPGQDLSKYELSGEPLHYFPHRLGLSLRILVAGRLNLTTGLEYSLFFSQFHYRAIPVDAGSGQLPDNWGESFEMNQLAHYLGVPIRLDWTLASGKWFDIYVGGGFEADYCLGATLGGKRVRKDAFGFSVLGAGGVQLNLSDRIGLYLEPEISWTIPSEVHVLRTYRTDHPLVFSLASGVRINLE